LSSLLHVLKTADSLMDHTNQRLSRIVHPEFSLFANLPLVLSLEALESKILL